VKRGLCLLTVPRWKPDMERKIMIDELDKALLKEIQGDLAVEARPFLRIARKLDLTENQVLGRIRELIDRGVIRRFGVTIRHQISGFQANAMAAWFVAEERVEEVGRLVAAYPQVTHCYHRKSMGSWKYNLFAMIHGATRDECTQVAREVAENAGIEEYELLFSDREHKKTSMRYF